MNRATLIILSTVAATVLADLTGYARARQQWREAGDSSARAPAFDWTLFAVRVAIGVLTGSLTAMGVNSTDPQPGGA